MPAAACDVDSRKGSPLEPLNGIVTRMAKDKPTPNARSECEPADDSVGAVDDGRDSFDHWISKQREHLEGLNCSIAQICMPALSADNQASTEDHATFEDWEKAKRAELESFQRRIALRAK